MFTQNEGSMDRAIRISAGIVAIGMGFFSGLVSGPLALVAAILGSVMLVTGLVGVCPLYNLIGVNTAAR